ncbi:MAG TPA: acylphosphatase [Candidatus Acidoferrales bacterium]
MPDTTTARLFHISGMVQGVGYRFFARSAAQRLGLVGYAKNLSDGRVEVYAIGSPAALTTLRAELVRGPRFASVSNVEDEERAVDSRCAGRFTIERDDW